MLLLLPAFSEAQGCVGECLAADDTEGLGFVQVAAKARKPREESLALKQSPNASNSVQDYEGIWLCSKTTPTYGGMFLRVNGGNVSMRTTCESGTAHFVGNALHIDAPAYTAGVVCELASSDAMSCSNGDVCNKSQQFKLEPFQAPSDWQKYVGKWEQEVPGDVEDHMEIGLTNDGEFSYNLFLKTNDSGLSGFLGLGEDGYYQGNLCDDDGHLAYHGFRMKLAKPGTLITNFWYPGTEDWAPFSLRKKVGRGEESDFPVWLVALPVLLCLLGVPLSCFFRGLESKIPKAKGQNKGDENKAPLTATPDWEQGS